MVKSTSSRNRLKLYWVQSYKSIGNKLACLSFLLLSDICLSFVLSVVYAECRKCALLAEFHYTECHYTEYRKYKATLAVSDIDKHASLFHRHFYSTAAYTQHNDT